jgi:16S rRNA processing protein RimM
MTSPRVAVGVIRKPHGVRGEASVEPWTDSLDRFAELKTVTLVSPDDSKARLATVTASRPHGGRALVKFAGIDSPEALREIQNWTIEIPEAEARKLEEGEYFLHDLPGLTLVDLDGRERGRVVGIEEGGGGLLLVVETDGRRFDVPFAADIVTAIDLGTRRATVHLPEGLDDLDNLP